MGDSLSALVFLIISTALNVVLDIWFVASFNMGVPGVALATVLAQAFSAVLCFIKLKKMSDIFDIKLKYLKPLKEYSLRLIKLGLPSGMTQAIFSFAMVTVQSLINSFGELVIASNVMVMRVDGFAMMPNFSFGTAMTTYAGQNVGAGRLDRVEKGYQVRAENCSKHSSCHYNNYSSVWQASYEHLYRYAGAGGFQHADDENSGPGVYRNGCNPGIVGGNAGCRRYRHTYVDFPYYHYRSAHTHRLRHSIFYQKQYVSQRGGRSQYLSLCLRPGFWVL